MLLNGVTQDVLQYPTSGNIGSRRNEPSEDDLL